MQHPYQKKTIKRKIQLERPAILFLQETKCSSEELEIFHRLFWKGARAVAIDVAGMAGRLGMLWNLNMVSLTNICASHHLISTCFHILGSAVKGVITNVYGSFQLAQKPVFLEEICNTKEWVEREH